MRTRTASVVGVVVLASSLVAGFAELRPDHDRLGLDRLALEHLPLEQAASRTLRSRLAAPGRATAGRGRAGAAAVPRCPFRSRARRQGVDPHRAGLCRPHRIHPRDHVAGEGLGLREGAVGGRTAADVKTGDLLYKLDRARLPGIAGSGQRVRSRATAPRSTTSSSNFQRGDELSKSGWLAKDSFDQRASTMRAGRGGACSPTRRGARAAQAQPRLFRDPRALRRAARPQSGARWGPLSATGGTVLNTLVQLDPIYVAFNPSETDLADDRGGPPRGGPVVGGDHGARNDRGRRRAAQGRGDLRR